MDQHFISGEFFDLDLPNEKQYLLKYFRSPSHAQFVRYMHVFHEYTLFREHTGYHMTKRNIQLLARKLNKLQEAHRIAKENMDFEKLRLLETGKYRLNRL